MVAEPVKPDPKPRKDNRCALPSCRKPRRPVTAAMRKYAGTQIDGDPFCSSDCCREWHGAPRVVNTTPGRPEGTVKIPFVKSLIDLRKRERLFRTNSLGRTVAVSFHNEPRLGRFVQGITHGTHWAYQHHVCRCDVCVPAEQERNRDRRRRAAEAKKEAA